MRDEQPGVDCSVVKAESLFLLLVPVRCTPVDDSLLPFMVILAADLGCIPSSCKKRLGFPVVVVVLHVIPRLDEK